MSDDELKAFLVLVPFCLLATAAVAGFTHLAGFGALATGMAVSVVSSKEQR